VYEGKGKKDAKKTAALYATSILTINSLYYRDLDRDRFGEVEWSLAEPVDFPRDGDLDVERERDFSGLSYIIHSWNL